MESVLTTLLIFVALIGFVLVFAANVTLVMAAYCFVEDAFLEHPFWGLGIILPPAVGPLLWWASTLLTDLTKNSQFAAIGFVVGLAIAMASVAIAMASPVVCVVLAARRWRQFRGYIGAMAASIAYLLVWVVVMMRFIAGGAA